MTRKKRGRILVLDDERSMREMLEIFLQREGYSVHCCDSVTDALEVLEAEGPFDLAISDINMPGLSGFDFLRDVGRTYPEMPVLMITAYGSPDSAVEAMKLGAEDYITKPFRIEEIKSRGGMIILLTNESNVSKAEKIAHHVIGVPDCPAHIMPIIMALPLQLLEYHIGVQLGCDVDQPRNLAKSVTVE